MTQPTGGGSPPVVGLRREREVLTVALEAGHREWPCKQAFSANLPLVASMQLPPADMVPEAAYLIPPIPPRP